MLKAPVDLSRLAVDRAPAIENAKRSSLEHKKRWFSRYALPLSILFGFAALLVAAAGNQLMPARSVTVVPVVVKRAELRQAGTALFQAPGWIEPRPTATSVAAMTPGVLDELLVVAGQVVKKNEPIARLISIDAELHLEQTKNGLAIREGELDRVKAELSAAKVRLENPVHLRVQLADAQSALTKSETELAKLPFLIEAAESNVKYTLGSMEGKQSAKGALPDNTIAKAVNEHAVANAGLQELLTRKPNLAREVHALREVVKTLESQLELRVEETRQLREAEAKVRSAQAYREEARLQVRQAELALERCTVRAPIDGCILRLTASPGSRVMGLEATAGQSSSTVVEMYDLQKLQIRTDVRLEDVPLVTPGQPVEVTTASSSQTLHGRVLQITSSANIQKNTLEVKVELLDPPLTVRPEMLATVTFLSPQNDGSLETQNSRERMYVPASLLQSQGSQPFVWVADENSRAQSRAVQIGEKSNEDLVEVKSGLKVTDKLITTGLDELRSGLRIKLSGDDPKLGLK
ncbi:MAG: efflux RND transporter periplasmic adaptor subunit [Pirellulaceae bacterium]|nr:efflux RND transporter periplasmic adaptor subunit [Pirellulaceae bacterium]